MTLRCAFGVALCLSLAACRGGSPDADGDKAEKISLAKTKPRVETIPGVSLDSLDATAHEAFVEVVNDVLSPCDEPISLARCASEETGCRSCMPAARYLARLAKQGYSNQDLRVFYLLRFGKNTKAEIDLQGAPVKGALMAPVTIVEFSDFQCPACRKAAPDLAKVIRDLGGKAKLVFKHFPLAQHTHAEKAARAAVAAQNQGKFWEYHDLVFENQHRLDDASFERFAKELGLDLDRFREDLESDAVKSRVKADRQHGLDAGVQGTPAIFVNGRDYSAPLEDLATYVNEELEG
jgi:predicted DsbA family dithiol-disulfide isomerase